MDSETRKVVVSALMAAIRALGGTLYLTNEEIEGVASCGESVHVQREGSETWIFTVRPDPRLKGIPEEEVPFGF